MTIRPTTRARRNETVSRVLAAIDEHFADPAFDLDAAAGKAGVSRRSAQRALSEASESFRDRLTERRMQQAKHLLGVSDRSVREVCDEVGYRQAAEFSKRFRRKYGMSPSEYRRAAQVAVQRRVHR